MSEQGSRRGPESGDPVRFALGDVKRHIRKNHPKCPGYQVLQIAKRVANREWYGVTMGRAVGIAINTYLRHEKSNYDKHLANGVDRLSARILVRKKIEKTIAKWSAETPDEADIEQVQEGIDLPSPQSEASPPERGMG